MLQLIFVFSFITMVMLLYPTLKYFIGKQNSIFRIKRYISIEEIREEKKRSARKEYKKGLNIIARRIGNAKSLDGYKRKIQLQLTRAHILLKPEEYIAVCIIALAAVGLLVFSLTHSPLYMMLGGIVGWIIPTFILKGRIKKRVKFLNEQLGDAIVLISNSLKAGYSFFQSVDIVAKEMRGPISEEFTTLQKEINLGLSTEKALENLVSRVSSDDLELVVTAVLIQRQVGGNLAEVLDSISSTIRERVKIKGEVRTITAQGRMSGLVISVLPPGLGVILYMINPELIGVLFKDPIGICILIFSIFMELIGIYFINKIVQIEI